MLDPTNEVLDLDLKSVGDKIRGFIKDYMEQCCANGVVLGMSGGLDSSTTAAFASPSLGSLNMLGFTMPEEETYNPSDLQHVKLLAKNFGFDLEDNRHFLHLENVISVYPHP